MNPTMRLVRFCYAPFGTYGVLELSNGPSMWACEPPWLQNRVGESCIPEGEYVVERGVYHRNNADPSDDVDCLVVLDVPGRTLIKIHPANYPSQLQWCIAPGTALAGRSNEWGVAHSREALSAALEWFDGRAVGMVKRIQLVAMSARG
jgi:hypothetical protein